MKRRSEVEVEVEVERGGSFLSRRRDQGVVSSSTPYSKTAIETETETSSCRAGCRMKSLMRKEKKKSSKKEAVAPREVDEAEIDLSNR